MDLLYISQEKRTSTAKKKSQENITKLYHLQLVKGILLVCLPPGRILSSRLIWVKNYFEVRTQAAALISACLSHTYCFSHTL